ncbi:C4-dicarboxylate ABC transporter permease [Zobellella taiwanensis]|uniref:TRAP transporter small permease protein n=1 Tax=Zobellella taiwanensis TaxID=347535 RepID=A0A2P7QXS1_9GAMM|nr:TRAP transporter small permease subunit [Zobellella taiwanensis]PSJ42753.1 C4-dicarboxylate ABC transporter permease [Zobellella taiwanensis]
METVFRYTLTLLITTVAGFQAVQVISRYVFETPMMGLEEMALIPTMWLYILGAVNASREDTQIRANVLEVFLKTDKARHWLFVIAETISLAISSWLTWWAWDYFKYAKRVWKESPTLYIPTIIYESALLLGLVIMTLYTGWHLLKHLRTLTAGGEARPVDTITEPAEVTEFRLLTEEQKGEKFHG